jgi:hypothetical protein
MASADEVEEKLVDAKVGTEFGVEGSGEEMAFANQDGKAIAGGQGFNLRTGVGDAWGANEDHLERTALECCRNGEDAGVDLATVGVALDRDVECGEGFLGGILYVFCEKDRAGTSAKGWRAFDEGLESVEEAITLEKFEEGGGLASRDDEAVDIDEFLRSADQLCRYGESSEGFSMGLECSLQGEHTYSKRSAGLRGGFHVLWFCSLLKYR